RRHGQTEVAFAVEDYDRRRPLIIDPVLEYATYLGGAKADQGLCVYAQVTDRKARSRWSGYHDPRW
ncbi:MAG: hypothetical protein HGA47_05220, partial [Zoogloea sp.]|nr:hypothetical protein [Zoogloea sp.]